jgi:hypothetical protein
MPPTFAEERDPVEEADDRMIGPLEVHVLSADVRKPRRELGPDEAAEQRDHAAEGPGQQDEDRILEDAGDVRRVCEDADADDAAGDNHYGVEEPELAAKTRICR